MTTTRRSQNTIELDLPIRLLLRLSAALTRIGLLPSQARVAQLPAEKRMAVAPARWLVGPMPPHVRQSDTTIDSRGGPLVLRVYRPATASGPRPLILWLHGGGFMSGGRASADHLCGHLVAEVGATVVAVEYRLTPDFAHPAALEDCHDALQWIIGHAEEIGGDPERIAIMGESAGANLTAALCLLLRDLDGPRIALQGLVYPGLDLTLTHLRALPPIGGLDRDTVKGVLDAYVGTADPTDPLISPLLAEDLSDLPRALIITADVDLFRDDGRRYATRLQEAGVPVRYTNYLRTAHGFLDAPRVARCWPQAMSEIVQEASAALAGPH